jgi:hypothetical protein
MKGMMPEPPISTGSPYSGRWSREILSNAFESRFLFIWIGLAVYFVYCISEKVGIYDWQKDAAYLHYIRTSFADFNTIPYFWWKKIENVAWYPAVRHTSNFVAIPETILFSPLSPLLCLMSEIHFYKFWVFAHVIAGAFGCMLLGKKLSWNDIQFRTFSILFFLSPIVIQHLALGYLSWVNLLLFPWIVIFVWEENRLIGVLGLSIVLGWILLEGGIHVFVWFASFIVITILTLSYLERDWASILQLPFCFSLVALLAWARVYPSAEVFADFSQPFQAGYNPINFLVWGLLPPLFFPLVENIFIKEVWFGVPSWDGAVFWGGSIPMGLLLLLKYKSYRDQERTHTLSRYDAILFASLFLLFFSFFSFFEILIVGVNTFTSIPFSQGAEKYPFRLALPAYFGFSVLIANFAPSVYRDINASLGRWVQGTFIRVALRNFTAIFRYCMILLVVGSLLAIIVAVLIRDSALEFLSQVVTRAYYADNQTFLSSLLPGRTSHPIEHYLELTKAKYDQAITSTSVVACFAFIVAWLAKKGIPPTRNVLLSKHSALECALAITMLFSTSMWLTQAVSIPFESYPRQHMLPPRIIAEPDNLVTHIYADPSTLMVSLRPGTKGKLTLIDISSSEARTLDIVSNNATFAPSNGPLTLVTTSDTSIVVKVRKHKVNGALAITGVSWVIVLTLLPTYFYIMKKTLRNSSEKT